MKNFLLIILSLLIVSCGTSDNLTRNERKAQKKLRKALKWDPSIISKQVTDTTLHGIAIDTIDFTTPGFEAETGAFNCDSMFEELNKRLAKSDGENASLYLYQDSLINILVKMDKNGKMSLNAQVKPRTVEKVVGIPYQVNVKVPGKVITQKIKYPFYTYWQFWVSTVVGLLFLYLWISERRKERQQLNVNLNSDNNAPAK